MRRLGPLEDLLKLEDEEEVLVLSSDGVLGLDPELEEGCVLANVEVLGLAPKLEEGLVYD